MLSGAIAIATARCLELMLDPALQEACRTRVSQSDLRFLGVRPNEAGTHDLRCASRREQLARS
jgi:hypothetical protein